MTPDFVNRREAEALTTYDTPSRERSAAMAVTQTA
jgi:hypothetical protein